MLMSFPVPLLKTAMGAGNALAANDWMLTWLERQLICGIGFGPNLIQTKTMLIPTLHSTPLCEFTPPPKTEMSLYFSVSAKLNSLSRLSKSATLYIQYIIQKSIILLN